MGARYLLRFDDICPGMNWQAWSQIEAILKDADIRPIVAVVPDNTDASLNVGPIHSDFWAKVREWQAMGWTIGIHGYRHEYVTRESGIIGVSPHSEFAGLAYEAQLEKIQKGIEIFKRNEIKPQVWVAPSHSFDQNTIKALAAAGIRSLSDGHSFYPYRDRNDVLWMPQQFWRLRSMPFGIWTICYHHNLWTDRNVLEFKNDVEKFRSRISRFDVLSEAYASRKCTLFDTVAEVCFGGLFRLKGVIALL